MASDDEVPRSGTVDWWPAERARASDQAEIEDPVLAGFRTAAALVPERKAHTTTAPDIIEASLPMLTAMFPDMDLTEGSNVRRLLDMVAVMIEQALALK